jgi:hypothetical protein
MKKVIASIAAAEVSVWMVVLLGLD